MFFLCCRHFWTYITEVEAPEIFSGAYFLPKGASENVQQSKIPGARMSVRGTDATGIAYNFNDRLRIYKRPLPARRMKIFL